MPPVYLVATVAGQRIRYLHSTPESDADADCLQAELNDSLEGARYEVMVD